MEQVSIGQAFAANSIGAFSTRSEGGRSRVLRKPKTKGPEVHDLGTFPLVEPQPPSAATSYESQVQ